MSPTQCKPPELTTMSSCSRRGMISGCTRKCDGDVWIRLGGTGMSMASTCHDPTHPRSSPPDHDAAPRLRSVRSPDPLKAGAYHSVRPYTTPSRPPRRSPPAAPWSAGPRAMPALVSCPAASSGPAVSRHPVLMLDRMVKLCGSCQRRLTSTRSDNLSASSSRK